MSFDRTVTLSVDSKTVVEVDVAFTEKYDGPDEFRVTVRRSRGGEAEADAVWHVHELNGQFALQIIYQHIGTGICLAGCLAGIVTGAGPLVDCLKKAKDRHDVRDCINQHGVWQTVGSLSCIYGCLHL